MRDRHETAKIALYVRLTEEKDPAYIDPVALVLVVRKEINESVRDCIYVTERALHALVQEEPGEVIVQAYLAFTKHYTRYLF